MYQLPDYMTLHVGHEEYLKLTGQTAGSNLRFALGLWVAFSGIFYNICLSGMLRALYLVRQMPWMQLVRLVCECPLGVSNVMIIIYKASIGSTDIY